ncbi:hypothetical protein CRM22_001242 [Opisthorchis felineus]|nr:hypothetical protein CRM22_001242 [Opisthorchis felineus]
MERRNMLDTFDSYSHHLSHNEQMQTNMEEGEPGHFVTIPESSEGMKTSWISPSQRPWNTLRYSTDLTRSSACTLDCPTRTSSLPSFESSPSPANSCAEPESVTDRMSSVLRTLDGIGPPLYCRTNTELPASALLVRRLSRLRNRGAKSNMHCCRTAMGSPQSQLSSLTVSPPSASEPSNASEQQQQLKETEPRGKYFTGCCEAKHSACSPSDLASCEIAFTIRVHPDDPSAKFLRDLALDGLARCCNHHHSVATRSG